MQVWTKNSLNSFITGVLFCDPKTSFSQIRLRPDLKKSNSMQPYFASSCFHTSLNMIMICTCIQCESLRFYFYLHCPAKTRKLCYRKDDRAMRHIHGCPENFRDSLTTPTATIPNSFHGLLFGSTLWIFLQNLKSVGGTPKIWTVPGYALAPFSPKFLIGFDSDWLYKCTRQICSRSALRDHPLPGTCGAPCGHTTTPNQPHKAFAPLPISYYYSYSYSTNL